MGRITTMAICTLACGLVGLFVEAAPAQAPDAALAATRRWLGGADRLAAVRALEIAESDRLTLRLLFPDRYQIVTTTDTGKMVTSFNGRQIFTEVPAAPSLPELPSTALEPAEARRRGLHNMAVYGLMYLARTLPEVPMTVVRRKETCGNVPGICLEFQPASGTPFWFVVATDGRPLALVRRVTQPPAWESIWLLDDYRLVDGIQLPFKVTSKTIELSDRSERVAFTKQYRSVLVNPPLVPATFERKGK